jgi:hypothetical protein
MSTTCPLNPYLQGKQTCLQFDSTWTDHPAQLQCVVLLYFKGINRYKADLMQFACLIYGSFCHFKRFHCLF